MQVWNLSSSKVLVNSFSQGITLLIVPLHVQFTACALLCVVLELAGGIYALFAKNDVSFTLSW